MAEELAYVFGEHGSALKTACAVVEAIPWDETPLGLEAERLEPYRNHFRRQVESARGTRTAASDYLRQHFASLTKLTIRGSVQLRLSAKSWLTLRVSGDERHARLEPALPRVRGVSSHHLLQIPQELRVPVPLQRQRDQVMELVEWLACEQVMDFCGRLRRTSVSYLQVHSSEYDSDPTHAIARAYKTPQGLSQDVQRWREARGFAPGTPELATFADALHHVAEIVDPVPALASELTGEYLLSKPESHELFSRRYRVAPRGFVGAVVEDDWLCVATGAHRTLDRFFSDLHARLA